MTLDTFHKVHDFFAKYQLVISQLLSKIVQWHFWMWLQQKIACLLGSSKFLDFYPEAFQNTLAQFKFTLLNLSLTLLEFRLEGLLEPRLERLLRRIPGGLRLDILNRQDLKWLDLHRTSDFQWLNLHRTSISSFCSWIVFILKLNTVEISTDSFLLLRLLLLKRASFQESLTNLLIYKFI